MSWLLHEMPWDWVDYSSVFHLIFIGILIVANKNMLKQNVTLLTGNKPNVISSATKMFQFTCEEWISTECQITVSLPYCPLHRRLSPPLSHTHCTCVCVWWNHLTPEIIAFRLVTGSICIHSGWDLFSGDVTGKCFHRSDFQGYLENIYIDLQLYTC